MDIGAGSSPQQINVGKYRCVFFCSGKVHDGRYMEVSVLALCSIVRGHYSPKVRHSLGVGDVPCLMVDFFDKGSFPCWCRPGTLGGRAHAKVTTLCLGTLSGTRVRRFAPLFVIQFCCKVVLVRLLGSRQGLPRRGGGRMLQRVVA